MKEPFLFLAGEVYDGVLVMSQLLVDGFLEYRQVGILFRVSAFAESSLEFSIRLLVRPAEGDDLGIFPRDGRETGGGRRHNDDLVVLVFRRRSRALGENDNLLFDTRQT